MPVSIDGTPQRELHAGELWRGLVGALRRVRAATWMAVSLIVVGLGVVLWAVVAWRIGQPSRTERRTAALSDALLEQSGILDEYEFEAGGELAGASLAVAPVVIGALVAVCGLVFLARQFMRPAP